MQHKIVRIIKEEILDLLKEKEIYEKSFAELRGLLYDQNKNLSELYDVWSDKGNLYWKDNKEDLYEKYFLEHLEDEKQTMFSFLYDVITFLNSDSDPSSESVKFEKDGTINVLDKWQKIKFKLFLNGNNAHFSIEKNGKLIKSEETSNLNNPSVYENLLDFIKQEWWRVPF